MLDELLRHNKLGSKKELLFVLFEGLIVEERLTLEDLRLFCISKVFAISESLPGMIYLLSALSIIKIDGDLIEVINDNFDPARHDADSYFDTPHFFHLLFTHLTNDSAALKMFNEKCVKYEPANNHYLVLDHFIPHRYLPLRSLLAALQFLQPTDKPNCWLVNNGFTDLFHEMIIKGLVQSRKTHRKLSLRKMKELHAANEKAGLEAEQFVLKFEQQRLAQHPSLDSIKQVSEEYVNAGYDIESFNDIGSIVIDRLIEVKSYTGSLSFNWSKNQVETAKNERGRYYLYLVDRDKMKEAAYQPTMIQDPYNMVFNSDVFTYEPNSWLFELVEGNGL